jgi:DNA polymerase I-like protein with 3'-5' exonuclease and polymerase domains
VRTKEEVKRNNGVVRTIGGRIRPLPGLFSDNSKVRSDAERKVVNSIIQGSAADIIKRAMVRWSEWRESKNGGGGGGGEGRRMRLVASIHDELLFEVDEREVEWAGREVMALMTGEGVGRLRAPLTVNLTVGKNWGDLKALNI